MKARDAITAGRTMLRREEPARPTPAPKKSAPYYARLPEPPTLPDRRAALEYLAAVRDELDADSRREPGAIDKLTRAGRSALQRLERRWAARATGKDARWNAVGTKAGRIPRDLEESIRQPDPDWK